MLKNVFYKAYRKMNNSKVVCTLSFAMYSLWVRCKNWRNVADGSELVTKDNSSRDEFRTLSQIRIAFICDEMTYTNFAAECNTIFLTPYDWEEKMEKFCPDLLFCESAWEGLKAYKGCWRGKIYRNHQVLYENRKDLLNIIRYCNERRIPTVFWNKEDPLFFNDSKYDFVDTALKFDYIYTTCQECIAGYKQRGHLNVDLMMFGVSPKVYNPLGSTKKENRAIFAGSWYADQIERCKDTEQVFDMVLEKGIELVIYDRNYGSNSFNTTYPDKYQKYIKPSVPYHELCEVIKRSKYAITLNTIKNSKSMFARRAFEIIMCNTTLISNESVGLRETFSEGVWFVGQDLAESDDQEIRKRNLTYVLKNHTNKARLEKICIDNQVLKRKSACKIAFVYWLKDEEIYQQKMTENLRTYFVCGRFDGTQIHWNDNCEVSSIDYYYCVKDMDQIIAEPEVYIRHFEYLENGVAIQEGGVPYSFIETSDWKNVMIRKTDITHLIHNEKIRIYCV